MMLLCTTGLPGGPVVPRCLSIMAHTLYMWTTTGHTNHTFAALLFTALLCSTGFQETHSLGTHHMLAKLMPRTERLPGGPFTGHTSHARKINAPHREAFRRPIVVSTSYVKHCENPVILYKLYWHTPYCFQKVHWCNGEVLILLCRFNLSWSAGLPRSPVMKVNTWPFRNE